MIKIRFATAQDILAMVDIEARCFSHFQLEKNNLKRFLTSDSAMVLVAELNNKLCGHLIMLTRKNSLNARLYSIAVEEESRQFQCGSTLLQFAEKLIIERGFKGIILEVGTENNVAKNFYKKHGYHDEKLFQHYYEDGLHAYRMYKELQLS